MTEADKVEQVMSALNDACSNGRFIYATWKVF